MRDEWNSFFRRCIKQRTVSAAAPLSKPTALFQSKGNAAGSDGVDKSHRAVQPLTEGFEPSSSSSKFEVVSAAHRRGNEGLSSGQQPVGDSARHISISIIGSVNSAERLSLSAVSSGASLVFNSFAEWDLEMPEAEEDGEDGGRDDSSSELQPTSTTNRFTFRMWPF